MKLSGAAAEAFCARPDDRSAALLLHGPDPAFTAEMRRRLVRTFDPSGMALVRLEAAETRRRPADLYDALRASGFFAPRPVVLVTGGSDGIADAVSDGVDGLTPEDGILIIEAGALTARGRLRKLFEGSKTLMSIGLYADPPDGPAIQRQVAEAGLTVGLDDEAVALLAQQARDMDRGSFARLIDAVALLGVDAKGPLTADEIAALLPPAETAEAEALVRAVMLGHTSEAAVLSGRLTAAGITPVSLAIAAGGLLRQLLAAAAHPGGAQGGLSALRPPVFGARRDAMIAILRRWTAPRLAEALSDVHALDRQLRSAGQRPGPAMMERLLLRLSLSAVRRWPRAR